MFRLKESLKTALPQKIKSHKIKPHKVKTKRSNASKAQNSKGQNSKAQMPQKLKCLIRSNASKCINF